MLSSGILISTTSRITWFWWHQVCASPVCCAAQAVTSWYNGKAFFEQLSFEAAAENPTCLEEKCIELIECEDIWGYVSLRNLQRSMKLLRCKGRSNICQAKCQRPRSWRIKGLCHLVPQDVFALNLFNLFMFIPCSFHVPCWCWAWMCSLL